MSSKEIFFSNAAIQNQEFSLDEKPYKAVGILAARVLNTLYDNTTPEVHSWNNVGAFSDKLTSMPPERIAQKYDSGFAQRYIVPQTHEYHIATDDEDMFGNWTLEQLEAMLQEGSVYQDTAEFVVCTNCDITIAEATVGVNTCPHCQDDTHLCIQEEVALFADTPAPNDILPYDKLFNQINVHHEMNTLQQIPRRLLLSRTRESGIPLDALGVENRKVDPRLGIGLLALYSAWQYDYESVGIVQSISTLNRIAPYLSSTVPDPQRIGLPDFVYALHAKIQPELLFDPRVDPQTLALYSLGQRSDITTKSVPKITNDVESLSRRLGIVSDIYTDRFGAPAEISKSAIHTTGVDLTDLIAKTNKKLGRSLELIKHDNPVDNVQASELQHTIQSSALLQQALSNN